MPDGDDVLRHVPHRVRGRAVDLGRVLAAERAATVPGHAAVGVDDDLATGEATVGVRATELERAGGVDEHLVVVAGEHLGHGGLDHVLDEVVAHLAVDVDAGAVLARDQHGGERLGPAVLVDDAHLRLPVGAQVVEDAFLADRGEAAGETVREPDRHRHEVVGVVAGVPEHHALVAGADLVVVVGETVADLLGLVDALRDVGRLLVDRRDHRARVGVEAVGAARVADAAHGVAHGALVVDVGLGGDLTRDHDQAGGAERLAGDAALRVLLEDGVEDRSR